MTHEHKYELTAVWTGNKGDGTKNIRSYDRSHTCMCSNRQEDYLIANRYKLSITKKWSK
jgi:hypothetical protein